MGRQVETGNIILQEDSVVALYCGNNDPDGELYGKNFLEAATIAQIRATSL
jgi:hypothetical protein